MCFHIGGKSVQANKCLKSSIIAKVIDFAIFIYTFEKQCFVIKVMLKSPRLNYQMKTFGIGQSLSNIALLEHRFLQNIKEIYQHSGKCDDQQQFKDILEAAMVSTPEEFSITVPYIP